MVAGLFHNATVSINQHSDDVVLKTYSNNPFAGPGINNTYSWSYNAGIWTDDLYDYYLNTSGCIRAGNTFHFHVAIDSTASPGSWRWIIDVDGVEVFNNTYYVEEPVAGIRMSSPTFYFRIMPYGTGYINSYKPGDPVNSSYFTTENIGNTPLEMTIEYNNLNNLFSTSNTTGIWNPGEVRTHYIEFQAEAWSPRRFEVSGIITGHPKLLATPQTVALTVTPQATYDVVVTVARQGYDVFQLGNLVAQYKNLHPSKYGDSLAIDLFLSAKDGADSAYLGLETDNLTLNSITHNGVEQDPPFAVTLSEEREEHVVVNLTCTTRPPRGQTSMLAYAVFRVEASDFSESGTFTSTVIVAQVSGGEDDAGLGEPFILAGIFIMFAVLLVGLVAYMTKKKAEMRRRIELEEKIRRRKLKALKKRKK